MSVDQSFVLRSTAVVHQCLSKPCQPDLIVAALERAQRLRAMLAQEGLRRMIGRLGSLPSSPTLGGHCRGHWWRTVMVVRSRSTPRPAGHDVHHPVARRRPAQDAARALTDGSPWRPTTTERAGVPLSERRLAVRL
jgi:hypothetical protein